MRRWLARYARVVRAAAGILIVALAPDVVTVPTERAEVRCDEIAVVNAFPAVHGTSLMRVKVSYRRAIEASVGRCYSPQYMVLAREHHPDPVTPTA